MPNPIHPSEEFLPPCHVCKKVWQRKDTDKYFYHESIGVVCQHHHGAQKWYDDMLQFAEEEWEKNMPKDEWAEKMEYLFPHDSLAE